MLGSIAGDRAVAGAESASRPRRRHHACVTGSAPAAPRECPAVDLAALEPRPPARDPRVVDLGEVFPRDEVRVSGAATRGIDLGRKLYPLHPGGGDPGFSGGVGLGFPALDADWVKGDVSPPLAAALDVWTTAEEAWMQQGRGALLLGSAPTSCARCRRATTASRFVA